MRLKKLSKTDCYKEVEFSYLKDIELSKVKILGHNNEWKQIKCFDKICSGVSKVITTKFGILKCHPNHKVMTNNGEKFVNNLCDDDKLIGYNGEEIDYNIDNGEFEDFYDIEVDGPHWYYSSGILSHNSIMLVNTSIMNVLAGKKVLHVTLENSNEVTGHRYLGAFTDFAIANRKTKEGEIKDKLSKIKYSTEGDLFITYFPTDTISVREIELALTELKRHYGFVPEVIVIDYLECLLSKNSYRNRDDYDRQKSISGEIRALAAITDTIVYTASQTNRSGSSAAENDQNINLDKIAESYGKAMPADYIVSINQSKDQYEGEDKNTHIGHVRFFFAKNRNGPKMKTVNAKINYTTMKARQETIE